MSKNLQIENKSSYIVPISDVAKKLEVNSDDNENRFGRV